jgi:hypothetical protein
MRTLAIYSDGSGVYTLTVEGDTLTTTITTHAGEHVETITQYMVRTPEDDDARTTDYDYAPGVAIDMGGSVATIWLATDLDGTPAGEGPWFAYALTWEA